MSKARIYLEVDLEPLVQEIRQEIMDARTELNSAIQALQTTLVQEAEQIRTTIDALEQKANASAADVDFSTEIAQLREISTSIQNIIPDEPLLKPEAIESLPVAEPEVVTPESVETPSEPSAAPETVGTVRPTEVPTDNFEAGLSPNP